MKKKKKKKKKKKMMMMMMMMIINSPPYGRSTESTKASSPQIEILCFVF